MNRRPPVTIVIPDPKVNRCPRQIAQHLGGCYCMRYICCGVLSPDPHAEDCGGVVEVHQREDGSIPEVEGIIDG